MGKGVTETVNQFRYLIDTAEEDAGPQSIVSNRGDSDTTSPALPSRMRGPRNVLPPPSRLNAFRWLWEAPGNSCAELFTPSSSPVPRATARKIACVKAPASSLNPIPG